MLIFTKKLVTNHQQVKDAHTALSNRRNMFNADQRAMAAKYGNAIEANQAALIHKDYWREVDAVTTRVIRNDEGRGFLADMMTMAQPISIGKTAALYRTSSDAGSVTRSMSGQVPEHMDNVVYDTHGDIIPIFKTGYGRGWREWLGMQTEGLDAMADDQEAAVAALNKDMALYMLVGDDKIKHNGYECKGLTNHKNTKQVNTGKIEDLNFENVDVNGKAPSTNDQIIEWFTKELPAMLDGEYLDSKIKLWVSPVIKRRLGEPLSKSDGFKGGTLEREILRFGRVESFNQTFLLESNHFCGYSKEGMFIRPRVAASIGSYMQQRNDPHADYNTMVWSALGLQVKKSYNNMHRAFNFQGARPPAAATKAKK